MRRPALLLSLLLVACAVLMRLRRMRAAGSLGGGAPAGPLPSPPAQLPGPPPAGSRFVSVPWTLVAAPAEEPTLTVSYRGDTHMELDRVDAQETPTQLFVTVLMRRRPPTAGPVAHADEHEAVVTLSRPVGERELVHAPVDDPEERPLYP